MLRVWISVLFFLVCVQVSAQLSGRVVAVADGDTFTMLIDQEQVRVRLHGIDCPERGQDFSSVAKEYLSDLVFNKTVRVEKLDTDRYGRTIGLVYVDSTHVNEALLRAGLAWHYTYYDKNPTWAALEQAARKAKLGIWSLPDPVAPWEYRRRKN